jgi:hypothetical protein
VTAERLATLRRYWEDGNPSRSEVQEIWDHIGMLETECAALAAALQALVEHCEAHDFEAAGLTREFDEAITQARTALALAHGEETSQ